MPGSSVRGCAGCGQTRAHAWVSGARQRGHGESLGRWSSSIDCGLWMWPGGVTRGQLPKSTVTRARNLATSLSLARMVAASASRAPRGAGVPDHCRLTVLSGDSLLENTRLRFVRYAIYTTVGSILIAVNPFAAVANLYGARAMSQCRGACCERGHEERRSVSRQHKQTSEDPHRTYS